MAAYSPSSVQDAWNNHFEAFGKQDVEKILLDYDESSVLRVYDHTSETKTVYKGLDGVRECFKGLFGDLSDLSTLAAPEIDVDEVAGKGGQVFLIWKCPGCGFKSVTDTFIFGSDFKIKFQNVVCTKEGKFAPPERAAPKKEGKKDKGAKEQAKPAASPEEEAKKKLKKVVKEGGKRGVEIEGAADMGGLQFFCTSVDEPEGDLELLMKCVEAMNAKSDPTEEERKGGSGHIGKMVFSCGVEQLALVAYVPEEKQGELSCKEWLEKVLAVQPGGKLTAEGATYSSGFIPANADKGIFPLKIREGLILEANNFLRSKGLFPEDNGDDSDEMVFGDDDFPS
jgi:hypothetical protein